MLITTSHNAKSMHARRNPGLSISSTSTYSPSSSGFLSPRLTPSQRSLMLGHSPPPSPGLPSLLPKHGKKPVTTNSKLLKRLLLFLCGTLVILWAVVHWLYSGHSANPASRPWSDTDTGYEMVGDSMLPQEPSAVVVTDKRGRMKWTVSIPDSYEFPLRPSAYAEICSQAMEVSEQLDNSGRTLSKRHRSYYTKDPHYLDVLEAEQQGLLPQSSIAIKPRIGLVGGNMQQANMAVCDKSLTYVMETSDAGFGKTLLALWTAYGLAQKEGRSFFVDDTRWPYGNFSTYFQLPPQPSCLPPHSSQIVPCPHNARHIVVSAATTTHTFGHAFNDEYEDPFKMEVQRQHKIVALAREGYENLFKLRDDDAKFVEERVKSLYGPISEAGGVSVGLHVRRGDTHPLEFQYNEDYIPLTRFLDAAGDIIEHYVHNGSFSTSSPTTDDLENLVESTHSLIVLASDDPDIYSASEFQSPLTTRAQSRIALASKTTLEAATNNKNKNKYIDEISGWEGGFYRDVFWSLGQPSSSGRSLEQLKSRNSESTETVPKGAMQLRELVGRSYLLDLAILSRADSVVCTLSATGCRLLGVMKGWDAIGGSEIGYGWKNVDGDFDWRGIAW